MKTLVSASVITALTFLGATGCDPAEESAPEGKPFVDSTFTIDLTKIPNYDSNTLSKDQYLAVVNYLRDLNLTCHDALRKSGPVPSLTWNESLEAAAKEHNNDMVKHGNVTHDGSGTPDDITGWSASPHKKSTSQERMVHNGFTGMVVTAENITQVWKKNEEPPTDTWIKKMENWMKSDGGSCSIIMNSAFSYFGMHELRAPKDNNQTFKVYWTQTFGGYL